MATLGEYLGAGSATTKLLLHLNGNSTDSSGNSNNGTDTAITYSQANGKFGQGAGFNGSSSNITCPDTTSISLVGNFNISVWLNPNSLPSNGNFMSFLNKYDVINGGITGTGYEMRLHNNSNNQQIEFLYGAGDSGQVGSVTSVYTLTTNNWVNLIFNYNGSKIKMYLNSLEIGTTDYSINPVDNSKSLYLGCFGLYTPTGTNLGRWFNGAIDEVVIENTAWTPQQVQKYYTNAKARFGII